MDHAVAKAAFEGHHLVKEAAIDLPAVLAPHDLREGMAPVLRIAMRAQRSTLGASIERVLEALDGRLKETMATDGRFLQLWHYILFTDTRYPRTTLGSFRGSFRLPDVVENMV